MKSRFWWPFLLLSFWAPSALAATYEEPIGRFTMTVQEGWRLTERPVPDLYIFKTKEGALYQLIFYPAAESVDVAFELTRNSLREALSNATLTPVKPQHPVEAGEGTGRLGLYSAPFSSSGTNLTLYGHVGAAMVGGHPVGMITVLNRSWLDKYDDTILTMFTSLAPGNRPESDPWLYQAEKYSIRVPGTWRVVPNAKTDEELPAEVVQFATDNRGGKVLLVCYPPYSGIGSLWGYNLKSVSSTADEELKLMLPASERLSTENRKLETGKARLARYESINVLSGVQLLAEAVAISIEGPGCWMNVIGYSKNGEMDKLEQEMIRAVESLQ